jgi:hypothetical protein
VSHGRIGTGRVRDCKRYLGCHIHVSTLVSPTDTVRGWGRMMFIVVYYESIKRELKTKPICECRCDERLKTKAEESTRLAYTGLLGQLEHIKIKTRLIDEMFAS